MKCDLHLFGIETPECGLFETGVGSICDGNSANCFGIIVLVHNSYLMCAYVEHGFAEIDEMITTGLLFTRS